MTALPKNERAKWIGASESAALLGASPFITEFELYHQKSGELEADNLDDVERVVAGNFLEPAIAAWAERKWSWPLVKGTGNHHRYPGYSVHPHVDGMGASLDYETENGEPVEIKNVDSLIFRDEWDAEDDLIIDAPLHYLIQVQHQLACRPGAPRGWLVACVGGNRLFRMPVPRHPGSIDKLEQSVSTFWKRIEEGVPPKPDFQKDADTIASLYSGANLGRLIDLTTDNHVSSLCADYMAAMAAEKEAKAQKSRAKGELLTIIKDKSDGVPQGGADDNKAKILAGDGMSVSLSMIAETHVEAHDKAGYLAFRVTKKKEK